MIRMREIRNALLGALLFLGAGMLQACASDAIAGTDEGEAPVVQATVVDTLNLDAEPVCYLVNGTRVCKE